MKEERTLTTALQNYEDIKILCQKLMESKHYQKIGQEGAFAIAEKARSIGMDPLAALNGSIYYVQGKVELSSQAMNELIRQKGHSISKDPRSDNTVCILHGKRSDNGDTWTESFSIDEAKQAGIYKPNSPWAKYPRDMMFARALSRLARQLFPDVIKGCYVENEIKDAPPLNAPVVEYITEEEAIDLADRLSKFPEKSATLTEWLKKNFEIIDLGFLTRELYEGIMKKLVQYESEVKEKEPEKTKEIEEQPIEEMVAEVVGKDEDFEEEHSVFEF